MPVVDVVNLDGKKVGQVELADAIFGAKVNQHLLHEASRWHLGGLRSALSAKLAEQKLTVVDAWTLETHKTKALLEVLDKLNHSKSALLVAHGENANLDRASRNIQGVTLSAPSGLQPYDVLK